MCTLTWLMNEDGYTLLFNRDELKTRQRAIPPAVHLAENKVEYLAPIDADAGGTWLAANAYGVTICLLNDYRAKEPTVEADQIRSRGNVVAKLAGMESVSEIEAGLRALNLSLYRGFRLVVFADRGVHQWRWNARQLEKLDARENRNPITSSSFDEDNVQRTRRLFYSSYGETSNLEDLLEFHSSHIDDDLCNISSEPLAVSSVCMHRRHSQTVSQCMVCVSEKGIDITYTDGAPCETKPSEGVCLARISSMDKRRALA